MLLRKMEGANDARCPQHMAAYRLHNITEFQTRTPNIRYVRGIEQKEIVMGLTCRWRAWATISHKAVAVCSLSESVIAFQLTRTAGNIVDNPVVKATGNRSIVVRQEQCETLCSRWHVCPVKLRGNIGAGTAKAIDFLFC